MANKVTELLSEMKSIKGDSLRLPLPRRAELEPVLNFRKLFMGDLWGKVEPMAKAERSTIEIMNDLPPEAMAELEKRGLHPAALISCLFVVRHHVNGGPIFTVSEGLKGLLKDTGIRKNVPCKFLAPPFATSYIEFDEADFRHLATTKVTNAGVTAICEGCYVQERRLPKLPRMSRDAIEILDLDPSKPVRLLELGFTASPLHNEEISQENVNIPIMADGIDFSSIYIQDEDESVSDLIEKHSRLFRKRAAENKTLTATEQSFFEALFQENVSLLTKILFYIQIDTKERIEVKEASVLSAKIEAVAFKKREKLKKQLLRKYDHIVVGPKHYTPISERVIQGDFPKGTKAPHYRSGTFGIRWVGSGQAKEVVITRIKESLVNKRFITDESSAPAKKGYLIK